MKKNSAIIILLLVLLASISYSGYRISRSPKPVRTKVYNLPRLYVDGRYVLRKDTGEKVILKGVSTLSFAYYTPDDQLMAVLDGLKDWGINLIGVYIDPYKLEDNTIKLNYLINWAEKYGLYVYLSPVDRDNDYVDQMDTYPSIMGNLAKKYRNKNNLIFGLGTEPTLSWNEWRGYAVKVAEAIIKANPDAVIVMTGVNFGRQINFEDKLPYKNIIYDFHEYPASNEENLLRILKEKDFTFLWEPFSKQYPIIVGEFGGVWKADFGGNGDLAFIQKTLDNINKEGLSYLAYTADSEEGLSLIDWQTNKPTRKGMLIKKDLGLYPPTDFGLTK